MFEIPFLTTSETLGNFDVGPDGRFIVVRGTARDTTARHLNVVLDWFEELNELIPVD